jgi:hypothetical protein
MGTRQFVRAGIASVLFLGLAVLDPAPASAVNMWYQQAIVLIHVPLGGGSFFTTNHVFTASEGGNTTVNVKCFNESSQRVGPVAGVNVELGATGQLSQQTPGTLAVTSDPLFTGLGWCWARNTNSGLDYNVLTTIGSTTDLSPGGLLNSAGSTLIAANTGLAEISQNVGGIPYFTTSGGAATYVFLVNPLPTARSVSLQLFSAVGTAQGPPLVRNLTGRDIDVLQIPDVFGLATPPASGSVTITNVGAVVAGLGYTGWIIQVYPTGGGRVVFTAIGLDGDDRAFLSPANAP